MPRHPPAVPTETAAPDPATGAPSSDGGRAQLILFTKPAVPGRVKTRLVGEARLELGGREHGLRLAPEQTAELHRAFLADVARALRPDPGRAGDFELSVAWALEATEAIPDLAELAGLPARRQSDGDLGDRLHSALREAAFSRGRPKPVAALGSDHPEITASTVDEAFRRLRPGTRGEPAQVVLGPSSDGGYFLIALAPDAVRRELFDGIPWSTSKVAAATLERCRELGLRVELLPEGHDVDVVQDLRALVRRLEKPAAAGRCRHTRALLERWCGVAAEESPCAS